MGTPEIIRPSNPRATIRLADGRCMSGFMPGHAGNIRTGKLDRLLALDRGYPASEAIPEYRVRDELARQLDGVIEARLPLGFADVVTATAVFEVEPRHSWQTGARQVLAYAAQCGLTPALALFGAIPEREMLRLYRKLRSINVHLTAARVVDLWWWTGADWKQITSSDLCSDMPHGARFGTCRYCSHPVAWLDGNRGGYDYERRMHRVRSMHCCTQLCPARHENVDGCFYWAARRAFGVPATPNH